MKMTNQEAGRLGGLTNRGTGNPRAVLTEDDVRSIRATYAEGGTTLHALADAFGVSRGAVSDIVRRRNWKHVQ